MQLIADMLMIAASIGAAIYCLVLAARLRRFTTLETGMGGAIAVLSAQVDDMTRALEKARTVATQSERNLEELTTRADALARRLELLMASLHDLPDPVARRRSPSRSPRKRPGACALSAAAAAATMRSMRNEASGGPRGPGRHRVAVRLVRGAEDWRRHRNGDGRIKAGRQGGVTRGPG